MEFDKNRLSIEAINHHILDHLILLVESGPYSDTELSRASQPEEYIAIHNNLTKLFQDILEERSQLLDYAPTSLRQGGFYYRKISALIGSNAFSITFPAEGCIHMESQQKRIRYENGTLKMFQRFDME
jgi:hypothetical protein